MQEIELINIYLGKEARKSERNFVSKSVIEPNCRSVISQSVSGDEIIGLLEKKYK